MPALFLTTSMPSGRHRRDSLLPEFWRNESTQNRFSFLQEAAVYWLYPCSVAKASPTFQTWRKYIPTYPFLEQKLSVALVVLYAAHIYYFAMSIIMSACSSIYGPETKLSPLFGYGKKYGRKWYLSNWQRRQNCLLSNGDHNSQFDP